GGVPDLGMAGGSGVHRRRRRDPRGQRSQAVRAQIRPRRGPSSGDARRADPPRRGLRAPADTGRVAHAGLPDGGVSLLVWTRVVVTTIVSVLAWSGSGHAEEGFLDGVVAQVDGVVVTASDV